MLVLDIGCGKKKRVAGAIGLDRQPGWMLTSFVS